MINEILAQPNGVTFLSFSFLKFCAEKYFKLFFSVVYHVVKCL